MRSPGLYLLALAGMLLAAAGPAAPASTTAFFVSPVGRDSWSGSLAAPNARQTDGPFATLTRARDAIRELKAKGPLTGPVVVRLTLARPSPRGLRAPLHPGAEGSARGSRQHRPRRCRLPRRAYCGDRPRGDGHGPQSGGNVSGMIRLIHEYNAYRSQPTLIDRLKLRFRLARAVPVVGFASVWIADANSGDDDDYEQCGMKLIGPVPEEEAEAFISQLQRILGATGVEVTREVVADD